MKKNHRRGFTAKNHRDSSMMDWSGRSTFSDSSHSAWIGNDFTNGHRGMAKDRRGAKKFIRTRLRFHAKMKLNQMLRSTDLSEE